MKYDGQVTNEPSEILETFRNAYADIGKDAIPAGATYDPVHRQHSIQEVDRLRALPPVHNELNRLVSIKEIVTAIKKQKDNACSPLDNITNSMLTHGRGAVVVSLRILFNAILCSGHAPAQRQ